MTVSLSTLVPSSVLGVGHFSRPLVGQSCQAPKEMFDPSVASRMKQVLDTSRQGIDCAQVRPFVKVAKVACEREVIDVV